MSRLGYVGSAALVLLLAAWPVEGRTSNEAFVGPFNNVMTIATTVPKNRDVNPYGLAVVRSRSQQKPCARERQDRPAGIVGVPCERSFLKISSASASSPTFSSRPMELSRRTSSGPRIASAIVTARRSGSCRRAVAQHGNSPAAQTKAAASSESPAS